MQKNSSEPSTMNIFEPAPFKRAAVAVGVCKNTQGIIVLSAVGFVQRH
jgi:hypothetical protein